MSSSSNKLADLLSKHHNLILALYCQYEMGEYPLKRQFVNKTVLNTRIVHKMSFFSQTTKRKPISEINQFDCQ